MPTNYQPSGGDTRAGLEVVNQYGNPYPMGAVDDTAPAQEGVQLTPEVAVKLLAEEMWSKLHQQKPQKDFRIARILGPQPHNVPLDAYDAFIPKVISIGPLHHGDRQLEAMESHKWKMLADILGFPDERAWPALNNLVGRIWKLEGYVRGQYADEIDLSSSQLVEMMVLDGCSILHLLGQRQLDINPSPGYNMAFSILRNDLTLLENQIPFPVLEELWSGLFGQESLNHIKEEAIAFLAPSSLRGTGVTSQIYSTPPAHLLHLLLLTFKPSNPPPAGVRGVGARHRKRATFSATELHQAGIMFKTRDSASLLDVSFDARTGELWIPQLAINRIHMSLFRNLVAFEQCLPFTEGHFTGYVVFMDNIINTPDDVKLLGKCGVLKNYLATDKEAAHFFNTLVQDVTEDKQFHEYYTQIAREMDKYCESPHHGWWVTLREGYFGNPWSGASVFAATLALFLTGVQAYFSAFPKGSS